MRNLSRILLLTVMASSFILSSAQGGVTLRGIYQTSRDDAYPNGYYSEYVGWNYALQRLFSSYSKASIGWTGTDRRSRCLSRIPR